MSESLSRRRFLAGSATAGAGLVLLGRTATAWATDGSAAAEQVSQDPFTLGVASGEPTSDGIVLWTRLAIDPIHGGGMDPTNVEVKWQIATDDTFSSVVRRGAFAASPSDAHSVHVEVRHLEPHTWYWYRFRVGSFISPVGRFRTMPAPGVEIGQLLFAFMSCQDFQNGYYPAYAGMAADAPDLAVFLGDYIYEYDPIPTAIRQHTMPEQLGTGSAGGQLTTLSDYRNRHAQYKTDPQLQAAHAVCGWIPTWDDHEVENNYANLIDEQDTTRSTKAEFRLQREAAYRAYWEHMPLRRAQRPFGARSRLYRTLAFGDLARFFVLDTRQYRTDQDQTATFGDFGPKPLGTGATKTLTGAKQLQWMTDGFAASNATWNVLANQVMFAPFAFNLGTRLYNLDAWDGYTVNRQQVIDAMVSTELSNPVVITGDIHSSWVQDVHKNPDDATSPVVATEFVGTSITSDFPTSFIPLVTGSLPINPQTKYFNGSKHGYVRCTVTSTEWRTDFRTVDSVTDASAPTTTTSSWVVESGTPGAQSA